MDAGCKILAALYIRRQAKQLAEQLDGVRAAEDIEFVHRARVATRRLRAALRMFDDCFARTQTQRWRKAIRRITAALGDARDRDVQIELLCGILSTLNAKECFPGVARLLVQLERDRERLQRKVAKAVDRLKAKGVLTDIRGVTKRLLRRNGVALPPSAAPQGKTPPIPQTPKTLARIEQHVLRRLDELLKHQDSLADPNDRDRHHAMRIAAKRLRYTLEILRPVYPGRLDEAVETVKKAQSLLGDVQRLRRLARSSRRLRRRRTQADRRHVRTRRPIPTSVAGHRVSEKRPPRSSSKSVSRACGVLDRVGAAAILGCAADGRSRRRRNLDNFSELVVGEFTFPSVGVVHRRLIRLRPRDDAGRRRPISRSRLAI